MYTHVTPADPTTASISTSEFRRRLAHYIGLVRYGNDVVVIHRKGEEPVYLISRADWDLLDKKIDHLENDGRDPVTGRLKLGIWRLLSISYGGERARKRLAKLGAKSAEELMASAEARLELLRSEEE